MAEDDNGGGLGRRQVLAVVVVAAVVVAGAGYYLMQGGSLQLPEQPDDQTGDEQQNETDSFDQYASADEESGSTDTEGATIGQTISIDEFGVTPARATIQVGEAVRWENEREEPVRLEFDRTSQTPTIQPGGSLEMRFRAVTYYDVFNADTDDKITGGSIATE